MQIHSSYSKTANVYFDSKNFILIPLHPTPHQHWPSQTYRNTPFPDASHSERYSESGSMHMHRHRATSREEDSVPAWLNTWARENQMTGERRGPEVNMRSEVGEEELWGGGRGGWLGGRYDMSQTQREKQTDLGETEGSNKGTRYGGPEHTNCVQTVY